MYEEGRIEVVIRDFLPCHVIARLAHVLSVEEDAVDAVILGVCEAQEQPAVFLFLDLKINFKDGLVVYGHEKDLAVAGPVIAFLELEHAGRMFGRRQQSLAFDNDVQVGEKALGQGWER